MPVANLLKLTLHWTGYGEEGTLSWAFVGNAASHTPDQLTAAAGNAVNKWETVRTPSTKTQFTGLLSSAQHVDKVTLYEYATAPGNVSELGLFNPSGWTGSSNLNMPLQVALVASIRTAQAGASYRGRQYFPTASQLPDNTTALATNAHVDQVGNLAANMGAEAASGIAESLGISTLNWVIFSPTKGVATTVTNVVVNNVFDTQRRREASVKPTITKSYTY